MDETKAELIWQTLVLETLSASQMIQDGLRRLCGVNIKPLMCARPVQLISPLYLGLLNFTSGFERLLKITISLSALNKNSAFPKVSKFGHRIGDLLDEVQRIGTEEGNLKNLPSRPLISQEQQLLGLIDSFAKGPGRYENLDFLHSQKDPPSLYFDWCLIANHEKIPGYLHSLIGLRSYIEENIFLALSENAINFDLESIIQNWLDTENENPVFPESSAVAMQLHQIVKWVAEVQDSLARTLIKDGKSNIVPYLHETTQQIRMQSDFFFEQVVMNFSDSTVLCEAFSERGES